MWRGLAVLAVFASCSSLDADPPARALCEEGCHWDCFGGGHVCINGEVWRFASAPRTCCHHDDPWPGNGPTCTLDPPMRCASARCTSATPPRDAPAEEWCAPVDDGGVGDAAADVNGPEVDARP
jgi:hypothetical protein